MNSLLTLIGGMAALFAVSLAISYTATTLLRKRGFPMPTEGTVIRIRTACGVYRVRLLSVGESSWCFAAPMKQNAYVPLRVGEPITLEVPIPNAALLIKTTIHSRCCVDKCYSIEAPKDPIVTERRQQARSLPMHAVSVSLNGIPAAILDLSEGGIKVQGHLKAMKGDSVKITLPKSKETLTAWVLEAIPANDGDSILRLRFESPLANSGAYLV